MRVVCLLVMAVVCPLGAFADGTSAQSARADTVCVKGVGKGTDKTAALKDAYRDAVERAVGVFVDAEQMMANEQLLKDQILTSCNAYIERCEEKKRVTNKDGLVEVTIVAWVRRTELTHKLRDVMPTATVDVSKISQNLYAEIVSKDKRDADAETLLKNAFDDFDPLADLMKVTVVTQKPEVSPSKETDDAKILSYQLKFEIDPDKYFKTWAPHMDKILSQISLSPGKSFSFKRVRYLNGIWKNVIQKNNYAEMSRQDYFAYDKMYFMDAALLDASRFIYGSECKSCKSSMGHYIACTMHYQDASISHLWNNGSRSVRRWGTCPQMKAKSKFYVALVKRANSRGCTGMFYELSDRSSVVISTWMSRYSGLSDERYLDDRSGRATGYRLFCLDSDGAEIASGSCRAFNHDMSNIGCVCWGSDEYGDDRNKPGNVIPYIIYMTPWVGCFAGECSTWVDVEVDTKDIGQIATVSVTPEKK